MERVIHIIGDINYDSYLEFTKALSELEKQSSKPVHIELCSAGGDAKVSLAFCSRIRLSPCDVHITVHGYVASAAVLILAYGDKRKMTREAWVMVHEEYDKLTGAVHDIETEVSHSRNAETQCYILLAVKTTTSAQDWAKLHKNTTYLTAEECLNRGLIDEII